MKHACKIENCAKMEFGRGLCRGHYKRLVRHGSPLAVRCFGCKKTFERAALGPAISLCDTCFASVLCHWCGTPATGQERGNVYPWCRSCREGRRARMKRAGVA